jgi:hypothetical protein
MRAMISGACSESVVLTISFCPPNDELSPPLGPLPESRSGATAMKPSAAS